MYLISKQFFIFMLLLLSLSLLGCKNDNTKSSSKPTTTSIATSKNIDETDKQLFKRTSQLFELFENQSDKIWNSKYRLDKRTIMYVRNEAGKDKYAYLINHPNAANLESAKLVTMPDNIQLPPVYRLDRIPDATEIAKINNFAFQHNIAGTGTYMMKYNPLGAAQEDSLGGPGSHDWSIFVAHEGFHDIQSEGKHWKEAPGNGQNIAGYPLNSENISLIMLENAIVIKAMALIKDNADASLLDITVRQLIAVRQTRISKWDDVRLLDLAQEHGEGTARYVERRLGSLLAFDKINLTSPHRDFLAIPDKGVRGNLAFGRFYETGAAICQLLDTKGIKWQEQVEQGKPQYDLLAENYAMSQLEIDTSLAQAKSAYDFDNMLPAAEKFAATAASEPTDIFK